jgi:hypothetical protein
MLQTARETGGFMKNSIVPVAIILALAGVTAQAQTELADWCVNLNGDTSTACNGAGSGGASPGGGSIDLSGFDQTLEPITNVLGSVVVNLATGNDQYAVFYADYDLDFATYGSFDDSASTNGSLPAGYSYSINDPNATDSSLPFGVTLFDQFYNNALDDTNYVGTASGPPDQCCDAAFALGLGDLNVAAGGSGTVTFTVSTTAPASGFYIQQTNATAGDSIYLSAVADIEGPVGTTTPEPSTFILGLGALGMALAVATRRKRISA